MTNIKSKSGKIGIADDVGVFGKDEQQHDVNLRHLMRTHPDTVSSSTN